VYKDVQSGTACRECRRGVDAAIKQACKSKAALVVYSMSRLARNTRETIDIGETLRKSKANLVSLSEHIDTTTAAGTMVFQMLAVFAEFERNQLSERTRMAMAYKRNQGQRTSRHLPYGTQLSADGVNLEPCEAEQAILAQVKELRRSHTFQAIADKLADEGVVSRGEKPFDAAQVYRMVSK